MRLQTCAEACVRATTRIRIRITNINVPAPSSITSLIKSGFSRSSRRKKIPPLIRGRLARVLHSVPVELYGSFDARCDG
jgi:hypothetical protein